MYLGGLKDFRSSAYDRAREVEQAQTKKDHEGAIDWHKNAVSFHEMRADRAKTDSERKAHENAAHAHAVAEESHKTAIDNIGGKMENLARAFSHSDSLHANVISRDLE